jgi:hypothetical protein
MNSHKKCHRQPLTAGRRTLINIAGVVLISTGIGIAPAQAGGVGGGGVGTGGTAGTGAGAGNGALRSGAEGGGLANPIVRPGAPGLREGDRATDVDRVQDPGLDNDRGVDGPDSNADRRENPARRFDRMDRDRTDNDPQTNQLRPGSGTDAYKSSDSDRDGELSEEEFLEFSRRNGQASDDVNLENRQASDDSFAKRDRNNDGRLSSDEIGR